MNKLFVSHIYSTLCPSCRGHLKENIYWCSWAWIICLVVFITTGLNTLNLTHNAIWRWNRSLAGMRTCFHYTDWKNVWRVEPSKVNAVAEKTCVFTSKHFCFALVKPHLLLLQSPAATCCCHTHLCIWAWPKHRTLQSFSIGEHGRRYIWNPMMSLHDHIRGPWIREWRLRCVRVLSLERLKCQNGLYPLHVWSVRSDRGIRTTGLECLTKQQEESANRRGRWLLEHTHTEAKMTTGEEDGMEVWLWCAGSCGFDGSLSELN